MPRLAVVVVLLAVAQPAFAQHSRAQTSPTPRDTMRFGALRRPSNSHGTLDPQWLEKAARAMAQKEDKKDASKPSIVCGLTIVPGDPQLDPKFAVPSKTDGVDYTLRMIEPPVCRP